MNDAVLSERLRTLREPPPGVEFERHLEQALWREAQALRAERSPLRSRAAARARRWGGRTGLTMAVVLGATAAAAAGGSVWVWVASGEHASAPAPALAVPAPPGVERPAAAGLRTERAAPEPAEEAAPPEAAAALVPRAVPATEVDREKSAMPLAKSAQREAAPEASRRVQATHGVEAPRVRAPERASSLQVLPLELPSREISGAASGGAAALGSTRVPLPERAGSAATSDRRSLPELRSRAERRRNSSERPDRARPAEPPGREIARERSGRDNAERGLERAREAHERK